MRQRVLCARVRPGLGAHADGCLALAAGAAPDEAMCIVRMRSGLGAHAHSGVARVVDRLHGLAANSGRLARAALGRERLRAAH